VLGIGGRKRGCRLRGRRFRSKDRESGGSYSTRNFFARYLKLRLRGGGAHGRLPQKQPDFLLNLLEAFRFETKIVRESFRSPEHSCSAVTLRFNELARLEVMHMTVRFVASNFGYF
jgi:hypothetical protein